MRNRSEENVFHCLPPDCIRLRRRDCLEGSFDIGKLGVWRLCDQPIVWVSSIGLAWSARRMSHCFELHQALVRWRDQGAANHSDNQGDSGDQEGSHHAVDDRGATAFIQSPLGQLADVR